MNTPPGPPNPPYQICQHCGHRNPPGASLCENCGIAIFSQPNWPPPPGGFRMPPPPPELEKLFTKYESLDRVLGALTSFILMPFSALFGLGLGVIIFLYIKLKEYRCYKQGLLAGIGIWVLIIMGAFVWCIGILAKTEGGGH